MELMLAGSPIPLDRLANTEFHGTSLGLPSWVERLAWKKFKKVFYQGPEDPLVRGWNVRVERNAVREPWLTAYKDQKPITYGHYRVQPTAGEGLPEPLRHARVLDYRCGGNRWSDPTRFLIDPLVALDGEVADLLLGLSYVAIGGRELRTPSFFSLQRGEVLEHVAEPPAAKR